MSLFEGSLLKEDSKAPVLPPEWIEGLILPPEGSGVSIQAINRRAKIKSVLEIVDFFNREQDEYQACLVGGALRDYFLKKDASDFDIFFIKQFKDGEHKSMLTQEKYLDEVEKFSNIMMGESGLIQKLKNNLFQISGIIESSFKLTNRDLKEQSEYDFQKITFEEAMSKALSGEHSEEARKKQKAEVYKCSVYNIEGKFLHSPKKVDKIQIIFRPDHHTMEDVLSDFDLISCQFAAINNKEQKNLMLPNFFYVKHLECLNWRDGLCEYSPGNEANKNFFSQEFKYLASRGMINLNAIKASIGRYLKVSGRLAEMDPFFDYCSSLLDAALVAIIAIISRPGGVKNLEKSAREKLENFIQIYENTKQKTK
jgi:hypothetical protein